jgi:hypothetical protein
VSISSTTARLPAATATSPSPDRRLTPKREIREDQALAVLFATNDDTGSTVPVNGTDFRFLGDTTQFGAVNVHRGNTAERIDAGTPVNLQYDLADLSYTLNGTLVEIRDSSDDLIASIQAETSTDTTIAGLDGAADIVADTNGNVTVGGAAVTSEPTSGDAVNRDPGGRPGPPEVTDVGVRGDALTFEVDQVGKASITGASKPANTDIPVDMFGAIEFTPVPDGNVSKTDPKIEVTDGAGNTGTSAANVRLGTNQPDTTRFDVTDNDRDIVFAFGGNDDSIFLNDGNDILLGGSGRDGDIYGDAGDDVIRGGDGNDLFLYGGSGNDTIQGGAGDERQLSGNGGHDMIDAGPGADTGINGGPGVDTINLGNDMNSDQIVTGDLSHFGVRTLQMRANAETFINFNNNDNLELTGSISISSDKGSPINFDDSDNVVSSDITNRDLDGQSVDLTDTSHAIFHDTASDESNFDTDATVQSYADDLTGDETVSANNNLDALLFVEDSNANDVALFRLANSGNDTDLEASEVPLLAVFQDTGGLSNVDGDNLS